MTKDTITEISDRIASHLGRKIGLDIRAGTNPFWVLIEPLEDKHELSIARQNISGNIEPKVTEAIAAFKEWLAREIRQSSGNSGVSKIHIDEDMSSRTSSVAGFEISNLEAFSSFIKKICPDAPEITGIRTGSLTERMIPDSGPMVG